MDDDFKALARAYLVREFGESAVEALEAAARQAKARAEAKLLTNPLQERLMEGDPSAYKNHPPGSSLGQVE
jgi:hypothetical protein